MLSKKSLRAKYALQLASASTMLILIFSALLYHYIRITIFETSAQSLVAQAKQINHENLQDFVEKNHIKNIEISYYNNRPLVQRPKFVKSKNGNSTFLTLLYPFENQVIALRTDTTLYSQIVKQILFDIVLINAVMIFLIVFYALFLSRILLNPIKTISKKVTAINEKFLNPLDENNINSEFLPFVKSVNRLVVRIQTFILYQKELFIGVAHELKTPLAVMKTKNEVTLLKLRDSEKYIDAINQNIASINSMNKMISSVLEIGRQEGDQFENAEKIDIIEYLRKLGTNFSILAEQKGKKIKIDLRPTTLEITLQPTLFMHIIQNFVQNAIKFADDKSEILIKSEISGENFNIFVLNEGNEIDEQIDYFAPFKRMGNKEGAGLGLFLAKGAAQAMNIDIALKNRTDGQKGVASSISINIKE